MKTCIYITAYVCLYILYIFPYFGVTKHIHSEAIRSLRWTSINCNLVVVGHKADYGNKIRVCTVDGLNALNTRWHLLVCGWRKMPILCENKWKMFLLNPNKIMKIFWTFHINVFTYVYIVAFISTYTHNTMYLNGYKSVENSKKIFYKKNSGGNLMIAFW